MEYIVGPLLALLLGLKFTDYKVKKAMKTVEVQHTENLVELKN